MISDGFSVESVSPEVFARMKGKSFKADCTLSLDELRFLRIRYVTPQGAERDGELVCNTQIAERVLNIFQSLYEARYPLDSIRLVDDFDADDERSMRANNCSCFNFRTISFSATISKHGFGLAVDINPLYNPYVKTVSGKQSVEPATAVPYLNRDADFPMKIDETDLAYRLFTAAGFEWGGHWTDSKDYQHFEIPAEDIRRWYPDYGAERN